MVQVVSERFTILKDAMDKKKIQLAKNMLDLIQKEILATEKYYLERTEKCEKMMSEAISLRFYKKLSHQLLEGMLTKKENSEKEIESLQGMCVRNDETIKKKQSNIGLN